MLLRRSHPVEPETIPRVQGGYRCIVADPPWFFNDRGSRATPGQTSGPGYAMLATEEIAAVPMTELAAPDAVLLLWFPDTHVRDALWLVDWWEFEYKHFVIWGKVRGWTDAAGGEIPAGVVPQIGMGHYMRKSHEVALLATRGRVVPLIRDHGVSSLLLAPRGRHSEKPEDLQDAAERLIEGPYLELFARRRRPGWVCWGDELTEAEHGEEG